MNTRRIKIALATLALFVLSTVIYLSFSQNTGPAGKANNIANKIYSGECASIYNLGSIHFRENTSINNWTDECEVISESMAAKPIQETVVSEINSDDDTISKSGFAYTDTTGDTQSLEIILIDQNDWKLHAVSSPALID